MALIVLAVTVAFMVNYFIAKKFADIAAGKGHSERKYFWICFLFGIIGYLWVIALPDICRKNQWKR